jgi:protein TonB
MLAYAPERRAIGAGRNSRNTLMLVVVGHIALVAVALTTKMTIDRVIDEPPLIVDTIKPEDPPKPEPKPNTEPATQSHAVSRLDTEQPIIPVDIPLERVLVEPGDSGPTDVAVGPRIEPLPPAEVQPAHVPVRAGPVLRTSDANLRPPYPTDKLRAEEEATLRLKLTIDDKGRVVAVDPVGKADPSFLEAARRHLIRSWRYKPATVDGVATGTTMVISLSFRLEDA